MDECLICGWMTKKNQKAKYKNKIEREKALGKKSMVGVRNKRLSRCMSNESFIVEIMSMDWMLRRLVFVMPLVFRWRWCSMSLMSFRFRVVLPELPDLRQFVRPHRLGQVLVDVVWPQPQQRRLSILWIDVISNASQDLSSGNSLSLFGQPRRPFPCRYRFERYCGRSSLRGLRINLGRRGSAGDV